MAATGSVSEMDVAVWEAGLEELFARLSDCFRSDQPRVQARAYVAGLLSRTERKNGWTLAEFSQDAGPQKMQRLLNEYAWDEDAVGDVVRSYVVENLIEPDGVLVLDETGFIKKGKKSAGVQRQYSGTAGRVENCQIGVFAAYVSGKGRALVDRELYLPESWTEDRARCADAGIPARMGFATKPLLALDMIRRFWLAHREIGWVAGDEVYGADPELRDWLEEHRIGYVLAVKRDTAVTTAVGRHRVDTLAVKVPAHAWETYSCADGSKGPRLYDWALVDTCDYAGPDNRPQQVLIRRARTEEGELAFFLTHSPRPVPLARLITVAGRRWGIEECFESAKNEVGLDHYQVRRYHAWYRHITLAILAHTWLAVTALRNREEHPPTIPPERTSVGYQRHPDGLAIADQPEPDRHMMIPLTLSEIRHLIALFRQTAIPRDVITWWSEWRRRHQALGRYYHYQTRIRAAQRNATPIPAT
ncbi:transposase [Frankia canadensis]|uniref:Transposase n=2 Tax=Frankia canadensis TaxID=1836972 RepID=A0A2I2KR46_9ACTN|nr:transposase [Frankia canadensis]SOU55422.1 transposase [Frankia canadensis]